MLYLEFEEFPLTENPFFSTFVCIYNNFRQKPNVFSPTLCSLVILALNGESLSFVKDLCLNQISESKVLHDAPRLVQSGKLLNYARNEIESMIYYEGNEDVNTISYEELLFDLLTGGDINDVFEPHFIRDVPNVMGITIDELNLNYVQDQFLPFFFENVEDNIDLAESLLSKSKYDILSEEEERIVINYMKKYPKVIKEKEFTKEQINNLIENNIDIAKEYILINNSIITYLKDFDITVSTIEIVKYLLSLNLITMEFMAEYTNNSMNKIQEIKDFSEKTMKIQIFCSFLLYLIQNNYKFSNSLEIQAFCFDCSKTQSIPEAQELYQALKKGFD